MRREEMISSERYCSSCGAANAQDAESCFACGLSLKITLPLPLEPISSNSQHLLQERYRILAQVGKGGFSAVYKAVDTLFNEHPVAIKAITLGGLRPQEVIEATEAFNREMTVLSGLKHPNLPRIYYHFSDSECWYLVMDFIEGITLEKHLETMPESRLATGEVLEIGIMLSVVLEYLHSRQPAIIFRDLKPANVMLRSGGGIALIDFGIARHFKPGQPRDTIPFGSPGYAAPEQYGKAQTTPQSDIYSLGALLHQLLSGEDPAETPFRFAPLRLYGTAGLAELEALIMRMVDMDPGKRPASAAEVKEEMRRIVMFRMLRTHEEPRIWRPGQPQDLPAEFPPAPWQAITSGSGQQQQQQIHAPRAGPSRRKVLLGGLLAGAALVAGTEGLLWLLQSSGPRLGPPAPVLKPVPTQQLAQVVYRGHAEFVWSVAWSPDGQFIASTSHDNTVQVWQAANGKRVSVYDTSSAHAAAWSPNGRLIAFTDGGAVQGRNPFPGNSGSQFSYAVDPEATWSVAWSPDGKYLAFCIAGTVQVWETARWSHVYTFAWAAQMVNTVAWSPDSKRIASGGLDHTVQVWNATGGGHVYTYSGHTIGVESLAWSPDGKRIASGGLDHTVQVWIPASFQSP